MFTFKTYIRPLRVLERRTEVMQRLLAAFLALPDEVVITDMLLSFWLLLLSIANVWYCCVDNSA